MELLIPSKIEQRFVYTLQRAGIRETGGVLMGECLEPGRFQVVDFSNQFYGGTCASFTRSVHLMQTPLQNFFSSTGYDYQRFNYLGEWHSHPSFTVDPSRSDLQTMVNLVDDPEVGASFAVLLVIRLRARLSLEGSATVFIPHGSFYRANLNYEGRMHL